MALTISASIHTDENQKLGPISLHNAENTLHSGTKLALQFLSVVEVARIPLHLAVGSPYAANTTDVNTRNWLSQILLDQDTFTGRSETAWWQTAQPESPLGILVSVGKAASSNTSTSPVTELLFYATPSTATVSTQSPDDDQPPFTPTLQVHAIALSSHLLHAAPTTELTPPVSPGPQHETEGVLLAAFAGPDEIINEPPVRKRRSAAEAFDQASERRKKARRSGGEGVAAAAASKADSHISSLKHRRSVSSQTVPPLQPRTLSRSPSIASSRPATATAPTTHRSSLSLVQSVGAESGHPTFESKNKDLISRMVMAGMRLYGLSQKKGRKSCHDGSATPVADITAETLEQERKQDEEYKLIYHQTFRGACVALRATVAVQDLQHVSEAVRDVVDQLLALFRNNPLADGLARLQDKLTPGGEKGFWRWMSNNTAFRNAYDELSMYCGINNCQLVDVPSPSSTTCSRATARLVPQLAYGRLQDSWSPFVGCL